MIVHIHGGKITKITRFPLELLKVCDIFLGVQRRHLESYVVRQRIHLLYSIYCIQLQYCYLCNMHYCLPHHAYRYYTSVLHVLKGPLGAKGTIFNLFFLGKPIPFHKGALFYGPSNGAPRTPLWYPPFLSVRCLQDMLIDTTLSPFELV